MEYIKNNDGTYTCPDCGVIKNHQSTMYYHIKKNHTDDYKYTCTECNKGFMQKSMLRNHIATQHPELLDNDDITEFKCPSKSCNYCSKTKGNLKIHIIRVHLADEVEEIYKKRKGEHSHPHRCLECKDTFKSMTSFYYHLVNCIDMSHIHSKYRKIIEN